MAKEEWKVVITWHEVALVGLNAASFALKGNQEKSRPYKTYDGALGFVNQHYKNWRQRLPTSALIDDNMLGNVPFKFPSYQINGYIDGKLVKTTKKKG